jgi:hypothetical protein
VQLLSTLFDVAKWQEIFTARTRNRLDSSARVWRQWAMLGLIAGRVLTLYRTGPRGPERWLSIEGDPETLASALRSAFEVEELAGAAGGWEEAQRFTVNAHKPGNPRKVGAMVFSHYNLDRFLGDLQITRSIDRP